MKKALLFIVSVVWVLGAASQGAVRVGEELARPEFFTGARIEVRMAADAAVAVRNADQNPTGTHIMYRVRLFSDNSQNAGENAYAAARQFSEIYPGIVVEVSYEVPYFWVTAGNFVDHIDAVALRGRVLAQFPKAVVARQEVPLAAIIAAEKNDQPAEIKE